MQQDFQLKGTARKPDPKSGLVIAHPALSNLQVPDTRKRKSRHQSEIERFKALHRAISADESLTSVGVKLHLPKIWNSVLAGYISQVQEEAFDRVKKGQRVGACLKVARQHATKLVERLLRSEAQYYIRTLGSARDPVSSPELRELVKSLGTIAPRYGIGNVNGGAATGLAMGGCSRSFFAGIEALSGDSKAVVCNVPLGFDPIGGVVITEPPNPFRTSGYSTPVLRHFQLRTLVLLMIGRGLANLYFPGGHGTAQELAEDMLSRQLADAVSTADHRGVRGRIYLVDPPVGSLDSYQRDHEAGLVGRLVQALQIVNPWSEDKRTFWAPQQEKWQHELQCGSLNPDHLADVRFLREDGVYAFRGKDLVCISRDASLSHADRLSEFIINDALTVKAEFDRLYPHSCSPS